MNSGDKIPAIGLGTWKAQNPNDLANAIKYALDVGYRHIDCAPIYMNEKVVGAALTDVFSTGNISREDIWITSKLWNSFHHPKDVKRACIESLKYMQLDYFDLFLMHWPVAMRSSCGYKMDKSVEDFIPLSEMPLLETWKAMEELVDEGLVKNIGVSNFSIKKLKDLISEARIAPAVNQVECHIYLNQHELLDYCRSVGVHVTAYSPLGSRDRPHFLKNEEEKPVLENSEVLRIAKLHEVTPAQVLLAWLLQRGCSVIPKSVTPSRIEENLDSLSIKLTAADVESLDACDLHYRYVSGSFFTLPGSGYTQGNLWDE